MPKLVNKDISKERDTKVCSWSSVMSIAVLRSRFRATISWSHVARHK